MIIKSFELEKLKSYKSNIHLIFGNNEGIKEDIINEIYFKSCLFWSNDFFNGFSNFHRTIGT